jgi:hypothetical protein
VAENLMDEERRRLARELGRVRDAARSDAHESRLPPARRTAEPEGVSETALPERPSAPTRPDGSAVNSLWSLAHAASPQRLGGVLYRALRRVMAPVVDAQVAFNSRQVQLDNELLEYLDARLDATHRHYDAVLGIHARYMGEINERHLIIQRELVAHVHDLVRRIDLVLEQAQRGQTSLEFALREVRSRLVDIERRLGPG